MSSLPADCRCAIALALDWDTAAPDTGAAVLPPAEMSRYLLALMATAEAANAWCQLFVAPGVLSLPEAARVVAELAERGHVVDLLAALPPGAGDTPGGAALAAACALVTQCTGDRPVGVRLRPMRRNGIQREDVLQRAVLQAGLGFISSDDATRDPDPWGREAGDKNAAMMLKHQQPRRYATGLLEIPIHGYSDIRFLETQGRGVADWLSHLRRCLDFARDIGGLVYAPHLHLATLLRHDPAGDTLRELVKRAAGGPHEPVRLCTYRELWAAQESA